MYRWFRNGEIRSVVKLKVPEQSADLRQQKLTGWASKWVKPKKVVANTPKEPNLRKLGSTIWRSLKGDSSKIEMEEKKHQVEVEMAKEKEKFLKVKKYLDAVKWDSKEEVVTPKLSAVATAIAEGKKMAAGALVPAAEKRGNNKERLARIKGKKGKESQKTKVPLLKWLVKKEADKIDPKGENENESERAVKSGVEEDERETVEGREGNLLDVMDPSLI